MIDNFPSAIMAGGIIIVMYAVAFHLFWEPLKFIASLGWFAFAIFNGVVCGVRLGVENWSGGVVNFAAMIFGAFLSWLLSLQSSWSERGEPRGPKASAEDCALRAKAGKAGSAQA